MTRPAIVVRDAVAQVCAPHLGPERARERAAQIAQVWLSESLTEDSVTQILLGHGGTDCEAEARSLAARVLLALDGVA